MLALTFGHNELIFFAQALLALFVILLAGRFGLLAVTAVVITYTILMNLAVFKQVDILGLPVTAGVVYFAAIFLSTDLITEHWSVAHARRVVWSGFAANAIVILLTQLTLLFEPNGFDSAHSHLRFFFGLGYPRVVAASMASFLLSQHLDIWLYNAIRRATGDRYLWLRNNASTLTSQMFDTVFFAIVGLYGVVFQTWQACVSFMVFTYAIKVLMALLDTPFIYLTRTRLFRPPALQAALPA